MNLKVIFSPDFKKQYGKIKDKHIRFEIIKCFKKLKTYPELGKPLKGNLANFRAERIGHFRLIYSIEQDAVILHYLEHRDGVYTKFVEKYINYNGFYN